MLYHVNSFLLVHRLLLEDYNHIILVTYHLQLGLVLSFELVDSTLIVLFGHCINWIDHFMFAYSR